MFNKIFALYAPPVPKATIQDSEEVKKQYKHWRWRMFYGMFIAYVVMYMCRVNLSFSLPGIQKDLHYTNLELGQITAGLYITYGVGKFINGILADKANVRAFLTTAVLITAIINIIFGCTAHSLWIMSFLWGVNGWFQSMAFPPIAKGLTHWFSQKERATKWAVWSTAHQVGTYIATVISGIIVAYLSWRFAFIIPGILTLLMSLFIYERIRDTPQSIGLPPVEEFKDEPEHKSVSTEAKENFWESLVKYILPNKALWFLAITYIFVYIVRYGTQDWVFKYLLESRSYGEVQASQIFSFLPLFGIVGSIAAGYVSDKFCKGRRMPVNAISMLILGLCIWLLLNNTSGFFLYDTILISLMGILIYGPQVLVGGVCAVETGPKKVASSATGFTGMFGYIGATIAGPVIGYILDTHGWTQAFYFWIGSAVIGGIICIAMLKNEDQRLQNKV